MRWRSIGPFRGGRVTTVAGVPSQPLLYYMGSTGGGLWKTEDGGSNWKNISDGFFKMGSVGSIALSDDDPNVIYAGMGESPIRGMASSWGDGVYKSTDAGRTWKQAGLGDTRQISQVQVHPRNTDVVYVAAQGSRWAPTAERGIYRSLDGGKSWKLVLHVDRNSGASSLAMDYTNPRVLYAAFWDHQRTPWRVRSGGPGSGIYKTTDGGDNWTKLTEGLPKGIMGKIGVDVSHSNPDRVWAIIEADSGGLFRSDDAGKTWQLMNSDRLLRARAWYYTHVHADPVNADVVYVLNAPVLKSIDGGRTFRPLPTPHTDNHALWINPKNSAYMINGNDGGANVSFNGGRTWSTQENQPTSQIYHVNTDARFPYWVYGAQQDNSTIAIASRTFGYGIGAGDWHDVGGCESAHIAFDPADAKLIYAGCYQGIITEFERDNRLSRNIMVYPALGLAEPSNEQKYRFNWSAPIATSPHDRKVIYHAGNVLFRSNDRGQSWTAISPDLTRNEKERQGAGGGPITNEGAGGEVYNTIFAMMESPHEAGTIWVGTDDGLVQLTRDGGKTWANVSPRGLGEGMVNTVEVSPHDKATAFIAVSKHKWNDNTPHIFKTTDYGRTWTRMVNGIRAGDVVRVVREDPVRRNLLYAGTETGAYMSFDGGAAWEGLQLNLPTVPVTDLQIREDDLVAATEGRAFWILDDLNPLRDHTSSARSTAHLFKPRRAYRVYGEGDAETSRGQNPPPGAIIYYSLPQAPDSGTSVTLELLDASGTVMRKLTSEKQKAIEAPGAQAPKPIPATRGLNRAVWDLRRENISRVPGVLLLGSPQGYRVPAGRYTVRLTAGKAVLTQPLEVAPDPRVKLSAAEIAAQQQMASAIYARVNEIHQSAIGLREVRDQVNALVNRMKDQPGADTIIKAGKALVAQVDAIEGRLVQPRSKTFQDVINFRNGLSDQYLFLAEGVDGGDAPVTQGMRERITSLDESWTESNKMVKEILERSVASFNALVKERGVPAVLVKD